VPLIYRQGEKLKTHGKRGYGESCSGGSEVTPETRRKWRKATTTEGRSWNRSCNVSKTLSNSKAQT